MKPNANHWSTDGPWAVDIECIDSGRVDFTVAPFKKRETADLFANEAISRYGLDSDFVVVRRQDRPVPPAAAWVILDEFYTD